jgi:hypothetical protein
VFIRYGSYGRGVVVRYFMGNGLVGPDSFWQIEGRLIEIRDYFVSVKGEFFIRIGPMSQLP